VGELAELAPSSQKAQGSVNEQLHLVSVCPKTGQTRIIGPNPEAVDVLLLAPRFWHRRNSPRSEFYDLGDFCRLGETAIGDSGNQIGRVALAAAVLTMVPP